MIEDTARDRAIYHALKAADEVAAALQTHLINAQIQRQPLREPPSTMRSSSSGKLPSRSGSTLRTVEADNIAESDEISLRRQ